MLSFIGILLLATIASVIVGMIWYAPFAFGPLWSRLSGKTMEEGGNAKSMILGILIRILVTLGLFIFVVATRAMPLIVALVIWLTVIVPGYLTAMLYEKMSWKLSLVHAGYDLVSLLAGALVLMFV